MPENHPTLGPHTLPALSGPVLVAYSKDVKGNLGSKDDTGLNMTFDVVAGLFNGTTKWWNIRC